MSKRVLVVDDEKLIVKGIRFSLEQDNMEVDCAYDGEEALEKARENNYDMILLDIMLPKMTGLEVCQQIREFSQVPIIMLTANGEDMDKILGLEYGADDYITKPFSQRLLLARIRAVLRRASDWVMKTSGPNIIRLGELLMDPDRHLCSWRGTEVKLTVTEFLILQALASRPGMVKNRDQLMDAAYGESVFLDDRTIDSHIKRLRRKLRAHDPDFDQIETLYGIGYKYKTSSS